MSIENEIIRLQNAKASIKTAIEGKGVTVGDDVKLDGYAELIDSITVGSGDGEEHVNPDFYNVRTNNGTNYSHLFSYYNGVNLDYISNWDTSSVTNMSNMFNYCRNLTSLDLSNFDTSSVTNMNNMFNYCERLTSLDLSNFDTSSVTNMSNMFMGCSFLTTPDLSNFNTSNVTDIHDMFKYCSSLTSLDLSNFDTSNVKDMSGMFNYCAKLISVDITGWDTAKVTNMNSMFYNSDNSALTRVYGELDLSSLTNGFYPGAYTTPIKGCVNLQTLYLKNIYKNCKMTNVAKWSINLDETSITDTCLIYIIDQLPDLINDKKLTSTNNIILTLPKTNTLTEEQVKVATDKGWQVANTTYDLPSYTVTYNLDENIITPTKQKAIANQRFVLTISTVDNNHCFESVTVTMGDTTITPTYISNDDGFKTMAAIDIAKVTADITITASAKEIVRYTTFVVGVEDPSVNNILYIKGDIKEVFINGELQNLSDSGKYVVKDGDIIKINNSVVDNSKLRFTNSTISSIHAFELQSSLYHLAYMFEHCESLTSLDLSNFDTFNVTDMACVFWYCNSLTSLDLSNFNTSNVTNMNFMFNNCASLTSLDLSSFDTRNVTSYSSMLNVPSTCTIYINPDTFINKSTGQTFTPAELGWAGTAFTPKYN